MKQFISITSIPSMRKMIATLALSLAALTLSGTTLAQQQVTRPFFLKSKVVVFVDLSILKGSGTWDNPLSWDGPPIFPFEATNAGTATHLGKFKGASSGVANYLQGDNFGEGTLVAANGDVLDMEFTEPTPTGQGGGVLSFTGGNGRFEGASGSGAQTQSNRVESYYYDLELDTLFLVVEYDEVVKGTITY